MSGQTTATGQATRSARISRKASIYRFLARLHLAVALVTALPLAVTSVTGALLVFGHELESLIRPPATVAAREGKVLTFSELLARVEAQRPDARVWAIVPAPGAAPGSPTRMWLKGGKGIFEVDPWSGEIVDAYDPADTPYNIVRALHRRWMVDGKPESDWSRTAISVTALFLMLQVMLGIWMWALPARPFRRLKPVFRRNSRLGWQRLHMASGVVTSLMLLVIAFTGFSMYWADSTRAIVDFALPGEVTQHSEPGTKGVAPVRDLDEAVTLAHRLIPDAEVASVRPQNKPGVPVHVGLRSPGSAVNSRVWVGDEPPRVLAFYDGRKASVAMRFWHFRYWLHIGDFAGLPVRILWVVVALMPLAFIASGLWLWRDRRRAAQKKTVI